MNWTFAFMVLFMLLCFSQQSFGKNIPFLPFCVLHTFGISLGIFFSFSVNAVSIVHDKKIICSEHYNACSYQSSFKLYSAL